MRGRATTQKITAPFSILPSTNERLGTKVLVVNDRRDGADSRTRDYDRGCQHGNAGEAATYRGTSRNLGRKSHAGNLWQKEPE